MKIRSFSHINYQSLLFLPALIFAGIIFVGLYGLHRDAGGWDWNRSFLPATQAFMSGQNPYKITGFFNPPWLFLVTIPFAVLPEVVSSLAVGLMNFVIMALVLYQGKANRYLALLAVFSPPVIWGFLLSNIDWLVLAGILLPPQIGLFFVLLKPQAGLGIALYWLYQSWKKGKVLEVLKVFAPVTAAYLLSFFIYGFYLRDSTNLSTGDWNTSFFPYSIVLGLFLIYKALKKEDAGLSVASAPFFSPYVGLSSWLITLFGFIKHPWLFLCANLILWVYFIINKIISQQ